MEFERLQRNWQNLAAKDPMWAILSRPGTEGGKWDVEEFFKTGLHFMRAVFTELAEKKVTFVPNRALDFGCGFGRLSQALATLFKEVVGIDVAPSMVAGAREHNRHGERVRYVLNERSDLGVFEDGHFDFVFTAIVMQHMRPEYQSAYLREFVRVLRPGGVAVVHIPTLRRDGAEVKYTAPERDGETLVEMYGQPIEVVEPVFREAGGEVLFSVPDQWSGPAWNSAHYIVRRSL